MICLEGFSAPLAVTLWRVAAQNKRALEQNRFKPNLWIIEPSILET